MFAEIAWRKFWATHVVLVVFLVFYCLAMAVIDVFGRDRILGVFLGPGEERGVGAAEPAESETPRLQP